VSDIVAGQSIISFNFFVLFSSFILKGKTLDTERNDSKWKNELKERKKEKRGKVGCSVFIISIIRFQEGNFERRKSDKV